MKLLTPTEAIQFAVKELYDGEFRSFFDEWSNGDQSYYQDRINEWMKERVK